MLGRRENLREVRTRLPGNWQYASWYTKVLGLLSMFRENVTSSWTRSSGLEFNRRNRSRLMGDKPRPLQDTVTGF